jgi:hypothetical protein
MFHATSMRLAALAARVRDYRLARDQHIAAVNGWQARRVAAGTWQYRDPRFDQLKARSLAQAGDRDG